MSRFDLVIWDCDGVLIDSERLAIRTESQILTELGWPLTEADVVELLRRSFLAIHANGDRRETRPTQLTGRTISSAVSEKRANANSYRSRE